MARLRAASGGLITFGASKTDRQLSMLVQRARNIHGDFRLAVMSVKGGVGKTTTTVGLGSAFASLRGDRVIAVDANPTSGTLARRIPEQSTATVRTLLADGEPVPGTPTCGGNQPGSEPAGSDCFRT